MTLVFRDAGLSNLSETFGKKVADLSNIIDSMSAEINTADPDKWSGEVRSSLNRRFNSVNSKNIQPVLTHLKTDWASALATIAEAAGTAKKNGIKRFEV